MKKTSDVKATKSLKDDWELCQEDGYDWLKIPRMPMQVHDVLVHHGKIEPPVKHGKQEPCIWVAEENWVYRTRFSPLGCGGRHFLDFKGLDTVVEVWLNGKQVAFYNNCYIPQRLDLTGKLEAMNKLELRFIAPDAWTKEQFGDSETNVRFRNLRKPLEDFNFFNGPHPHFTPMGVYDDVMLTHVPTAEIDWLDVRARLNDDLSEGALDVEPHINNYSDEGDLIVETKLFDPDGNPCDGLTVSTPALWYPVGHGGQPLYRLEVLLKKGDEIIDQASRTVGFRKVERHGEFDYSINGKKVKLWGANYAPMATGGHTWDAGMCDHLMDMALRCNMNTLRLWGPAHPWNEQVLEAADQRGILIWFEFAHTGAPFPGNEEFLAACRGEAEYWLKSWKHHPSILFWCGGNETFLGLDIDRPGMEQGDVTVFMETYPDVCKQLDPERDYICNSPHKGPYGNCTWTGDSHIRSYEWFQSGMEFPLLPSEHIRLTIPLKKTLQVHLGEDLQWPKGHKSHRCDFNDPLLPHSWDSLTPNPHWCLNRVGLIKDFFDPDGTPENLIFLIGAGCSRYIDQTIERFRRGKPFWDADGERRVMGHYWWKYNDTFPMIYACLIDDLGEPNMPYYAMRRAYAPLLLSVEIADSINLWVVNDTAEDMQGTIRVTLMDQDGLKEMKQIEMSADVKQGNSELIGNCDEFGMFYSRNPVFAELLGKDGNVLAEKLQYTCPDRHSWFPEAQIAIESDGDAIVLTTDKIARWVELEGNAEGDQFGWYFEDNFFELVPGRPKRVRILGRHDKGTITAKSAYSPHAASIEWKR